MTISPMGQAVPLARPVPAAASAKGAALGGAAGGAIGVFGGVLLGLFRHQPGVAMVAGGVLGVLGAAAGAAVGNKIQSNANFHSIGTIDGYKEVRYRSGSHKEEYSCTETNQGRSTSATCVRTVSEYSTRWDHAKGELGVSWRLGSPTPYTSIEQMSADLKGKELGPGGAAIMRVDGGYALQRERFRGVDLGPSQAVDNKLDNGDGYHFASPDVVGLVTLSGMTPRGGISFNDGAAFQAIVAAPTATPAERAALEKIAL